MEKLSGNGEDLAKGSSGGHALTADAEGLHFSINSKDGNADERTSRQAHPVMNL
jgi:hypothetical protein